MLTPMEQYRSAKAEMRAAMEKANSFVKDAFRAAALTVFQQHPELTSFRWTQYTPYFNDGDECVFGAHTDYPYLNGEDEEVWGDDHPLRAANDSVVAFLSEFDEDDYREMFGDHCRVTVTRDTIEVEGYEHD